MTKAQSLWDLAKTRRMADGSKPDTVLAMEALEQSKFQTLIRVGPSGNGAGPKNLADARNPERGSPGEIEFNPNLGGRYNDSVARIPEASLAHEAFHVYQFITGTTPELRSQVETSAASAENMHRAAMRDMGVPGVEQRLFYFSPMMLRQY